MTNINAYKQDDIISSNKWHRLYLTDFTAQPKRSFIKTNEAVINSKKWNVINQQNASIIEVSEEGFFIKVNGNYSEWYNALHTAPAFVLPLDLLFDGYNSIFADPKKFKLRITSEVFSAKCTHNYEEVIVGLDLPKKGYGNINIAQSRYFDYTIPCSMRLATNKTFNNKTLEKSIDYVDLEENICVFDLYDSFDVDIYSKKPGGLSKLIESVSWNDDELFDTETNPMFNSYSELNFVFGVSSGGDYRSINGFLKNICIEAQAK